MNLTVEHFECEGAGPDSPPEGFEVRESSVASIMPNDFLLDSDVQELRDRGVHVTVVFPQPEDHWDTEEYEEEYATA
jgi:hypothetical protein